MTQHDPKNTNPDKGNSDTTTAHDLERKAWRLFGETMLASQTVGDERNTMISRMVDEIMSDPAVSQSFLQVLDSFNDHNLYEQVQDALVDAANPFTGMIPESFQLEPALQAVYDATPDLQEFRRNLPTFLGYQEAESETAASPPTPGARIRTTLQPWIKRGENFGRVVRKALDPSSSTPLGFVVRGASAPDTNGQESPPLQEVSPTEERQAAIDDQLDETTFTFTGQQVTSRVLLKAEDKSMYVAEVWVRTDDATRIRVRLEGYADAEGSRYISYQGWTPGAVLDGVEIGMKPDSDKQYAWVLETTLSRDELKRLSYEVE